MKQYLKHDNLPWLTLLCGSIGLVLRLWLLSTENDKGFITRWHISEILLTVLTVVFIAALFLVTRSLTQGNKYRFNFPVSPVGAVCAALAAGGIALVSLAQLFGATILLDRICWLLGLPAALALLYAAYCRWQGTQPHMLLHAFLCTWLILVLVCQYRHWSADPQLENYCYQLLALVFAMLSSYHRAAFAADFGKRSSHAFFSLGCVYFCCLSVAGPHNILLYLCLGAWQVTDLCRLNPMPRQFRREDHEAA